MKHYIRAAVSVPRLLMSPSVLAAVGVLVVTVIALFTPPYIGMADNGDFFRVLYGNGIYFNQPDYDSQYFGYFVKEYGIFQYFNENAGSLLSSHSFLIRFALLVNRLLVDGMVFDIRVMGAIHTLLFTAAVYLLVESITWRMPGKYGYIVAALAVFMFADTGYTAYFNSFYGEGLVYIMLLVLFAAWLLLYRGRYNDWVLLAIFVFSAFILTTSKQQNAPVGVIVAIMGISLIVLRRSRPYRVAVSLSLIALLAAGVATYVWIPKEFVNINKYHAMTRGVLLDSPDPEGDLRFFGIDRQYALLKETVYYELYATADVDSPKLEAGFYNRYGFGSIVAFYAAHPDRLLSILDTAAQSAFTIRPGAMGNYEKTAGKAFGEQTRFFSAYSLIKKEALPKTFGFIVIWLTMVTVCYAPSFWAAVKARDPRGSQKLILIVTTAGIGLSGMVVSIIGAGDADLAKHEFLFTVAFDLVTFLAVADAVGKSFSADSRLGRRFMRRRVPAREEGATA